jgi:hypothetical protein
MLMSRVILLFVLVVLFSGCRGVSFFGDKPSNPPPVVTTVNPAPIQQMVKPLSQKKIAVDTVVSYLTALKKRKYSAAYMMLSQDSRKLFKREKFEQLAREGIPQFDFPAKSVKVDGDDAKVTMMLNSEEDQTSHDFILVREGGLWRIVYRGGLPHQPYGD